MTNFLRKCPICDKYITYNNKYAMLNAEKKKSNCKSCGMKLSITDERKEQMKLRVSGDKNPMYGKFGSENPFYGKKHTLESKKKIIENRDYSPYKTEEFRKKISLLTTGNKNPMFGKTVYSIWVQKYGKELADIKLSIFRKKNSDSNSGRKNPMFGKSSPMGSGNGWSGWYKGWFFRSLKELSYMINIIERYDIKWVSGESKEYTINYFDHKNTPRTYRPDFILNEKYMVEVKPKKLWNSDNVKRKKESALDFCRKNNLKYKLVDLPNLSIDTILNLHKSKKIIFTERYERKLLTFLSKVS